MGAPEGPAWPAALVEHASDIIDLVRADGVIVHANPAWSRLLDWRPDEVVGHTVLGWVHPDDQERVADLHRELLQRPGGAVEFGCRLRHRDGSWRQMEVIQANHLDHPDIGAIVATKRDLSETLTTAAQLDYLAGHDPLTRLPNRALLLERIAFALARSERTGAPVALLCLDLDDFKAINDSLSHAIGDDLLRLIAARLLRVVRPEDTVARLSGDEFVVLAERVASPQDAIDLAERVQEAIGQPAQVGGRTIHPSGSIGIALSRHQSGEALLQESDTAMYRAKARGRRRWELYDQAMRTAARRRLDTEGELRRALEGDGSDIVVLYQPIVRMADRTLAGVEALVRIRSAQGRVLAPGDFIEVAEESGLILPLGNAILDAACTQGREWSDRLGDRAPGRLSVNLSARQLEAPRLTTTVADALAQHHLDPAKLCLELTESVLIGAGPPVRRTIDELSAMGVRLAMDDFGTGYSSLSYLQRFPIDTLKVDRSFVSGLGVSQSDTELVKAVLTLGQALELDVVAEGVETEEQSDLLAEMGCVDGQGWLYGRPAGPAQIEELALGGVGAGGSSPAGA